MARTAPVRTDRIWRTSSCRFEDQDIFAVSLFLRTGCITDFAYAVSVPTSIDADLGLPAVPKFLEHVTQNPPISDPPSGPWTSSLRIATQPSQRSSEEAPSASRNNRPA